MNESNVQTNNDFSKPNGFDTMLDKYLQTGNDGSPYSDRMQKDFRRAITGFKNFVQTNTPVNETQYEEPKVNMMSVNQPLRTGLEMVNGKYIYKIDQNSYNAVAPTKEYKDYDDLSFDIASHIESGHNLLIEGHSGIGKTQKIHEECAKRGIKLITLMCNEGTKLSDLKGHKELEGDITPYMLGVLPTAIEIANTEGQVVIYIDELGLLSPQMQGVLNETLDFRKSVTIESIGMTYKLEEKAKLIVIASTNPSTYGGRNPINPDLNARFNVRELRSPTVDEVETIVSWDGVPENLKKGILGMYEQLVSASHTREVDYTFSPRDLDNLVEQLLVNFKITQEIVSEDDSMFETKAFKRIVQYIYSKYRAEPDSHRETVAKIIASCTNITI